MSKHKLMVLLFVLDYESKVSKGGILSLSWVMGWEKGFMKQNFWKNLSHIL